MKKIWLLAGATAFAFGSPALSKPGNDHSGHGQGHGAKTNGKTKGNVVVDARAKSWAFDSRGNCPPGLDKKNNGCLPPGQAKKLYNVGQRYNRDLGNVWTYNQIPTDMRQSYRFDPTDRYYYDQGYLYQVDPKTLLVQQVVSALLR